MTGRCLFSRLLSSLIFPSESWLLCIREESFPCVWCICLASATEPGFNRSITSVVVQGVERPPPDKAGSVCWEAEAGPWSLCSFTAVLGEEAETLSCRHAEVTQARSWVWTRSTGSRAFVLSHRGRLFRRLSHPWGVRTVEMWG